MELGMEFATFCNICFIKASLRKIEKTEHLLNILMILIENKIVLKEQEVYLCLNCCEKLKSYDQFKEMCLRNFIDFRVEYFELKKKLEINSDPHVENKLRNFIETKVYKTCDTIKPNDSQSIIKIECSTISMPESKNILTEKDEGNSCNYDFESVTCKTENLECDDKEEYKFHSELDLENSEDDCELAVPVENIKKGDSCVEKDIGVSESNSKNELSESLESALSRENEQHRVMDFSHCQYEKPERSSTLNINTQPINQKTPENECKICKEKFVNDDNLKKHMLVHNGERPFVCTVCNKSFTKSSILKAHQLVHTGEKRYKCDICNKTYTKLSNLKSHHHSHTGKKPYVCKVCNKTYAHLRTLKAHEYEHTGKMPHICTICNKTFPLPERLTVHMHIHSDEKPYTCLVCNKTFRRLLHLKEHERVHTGEKPYACSMCEKTFGTSGYLKLHLLVHTGEKPYTCRVCEKSFRHISHLKAHERVHIDEKPYECTICNKRFTHLSSYKSHKLTHTGEKPYSCTACNNTFRQLSTLRRHERTHTGVKPYSCDKCKKSYREKGDLRLHQQKPCVLNDLQLEGVTTQLSEET